MNVIRIHPEVQPVPVVATYEPMRRIHWKGARDYWTCAKQARRSGQPDLAATILASARQALTIATATDPFRTLRRLAAEQHDFRLRACFTDHCHGTPTEGVPVPLRCPYCGEFNRASIVEAVGPDEEGSPAYYVECGSCGAQGPGGTTQVEAARRWNSRPNSGREASQ